MSFLLLPSILFASLNSILLHRVKITTPASVFGLNAIGSLVWLLCLSALNGFSLHVSRPILIFGILYGVTQTLFILFKLLAMNSGPVSVTTLCGNASLLLSVIVCYFAFGEPITFGDGIGLFLLLAALLLLTYQKGRGGAAMSARWGIYTLLFLVLGAGVGIAFKAFGKSGLSSGTNDMMIMAAAVMLLIFSPLWLFFRRKEAKSAPALGRGFFVVAILSGLLACLYNRLNIYLAGILDAILFFPFFNGGVVLTSAVCSVLFTKEKMDVRKAVGLFLGIAAIAVIGVF